MGFCPVGFCPDTVPDTSVVGVLHGPLTVVVPRQQYSALQLLKYMLYLYVLNPEYNADNAVSVKVAAVSLQVKTGLVAPPPPKSKN